MKKTIIILSLLAITTAATYLLLQNEPAKINSPDTNSASPASAQPEKLAEDSGGRNPAAPQDRKGEGQWQAPLGRPKDRITKKNFGIYITPRNSPVKPERFSGYHTGADFEIFPEELNADIPVRAVCSGKLKLKKHAAGYGGVVVEQCVLDNQPVTIIYGHLKLSSVAARPEDDIKIGETLGILGAAYSPETDGERKHLHLGFHRGEAIDIKGYVPSSSALSQWLDPCLYACGDFNE